MFREKFDQIKCENRSRAAEPGSRAGPALLINMAVKSFTASGPAACG